ncbi:MAG: SAM-dependent methyltransferase [Pseudomonadota bacterium]
MSRATFVAVAVISAAILAYQVLLVRLFAIVSWHHFATMIISIALLGFGASGTVLALARRRLVPRFPAVFAICAALFGVTAIVGFSLAIRLPFNPLAIVWDGRQILWLGLSYLVLVVPFFFGGAAIGLSFARYTGEIGRLYAYDLVGAGVGALGVVAVLFAVPPDTTLRLIAALGLLAAAMVLVPSGTFRARGAAAGLGVAALAVAVWLPPALTAFQPHISQYKGLSTALLVPDTRVIAQRSSPLGLVDVVESPTIPFRHAPGLSFNNLTEPPPQIGLFTDADGFSAITRFDGDLDPLVYLDFTTAALPYHLVADPSVLVLGAGGGEQVLLALTHGAPEIDAVELNGQVVDLVADVHADFAGGLYTRPDVDVHIDEARSFVRGTGARYDLIQMPPLASFGTAAAGMQGLHATYTYTVEAMRDYLAALRPGGLLSITLWLKLPPRDTVRLFATAVAALEAMGVDPADRLALIRSWNTATLLVKNGAFEAAEIAALRDFAAGRSFDLAYYPGMGEEEANRYNLLDQPYFFDAATALLGPDAQDFIARYKFDIAPATDDRPFFHDFFRWRSLPELWSLRTQGAAAMLDMGTLILFATLAQAVVFSVLLILAPLVIRRRRFGGGAPRARVSLYFLALGLAFLFIEIAFIQRFILFLGHPLYAVAVVLAGFLVFAGMGSALSTRLDRSLQARGSKHGGRWPRRALDVAVVGIVCLSIGYVFILPPLFQALIALPDIAKIAIALALIAPLACCMGMPFPLGIARVAKESADFVPWAWGINGCASVISAILATILAIHIGFTGVVMIAALLYLATPFLLRGSGAEMDQSIR